MAEPAPIYAGERGPKELQKGWRWSSRTGWQTTRRWVGFYDELKTLMDEHLALGSDVSLDPGDVDFYTLTVAVASEIGPSGTATNPDSQVLTIWSMPNNDLEKELWDLPRLRVVTETFALGDITRIRSMITKVLDGDKSYGDYVDLLTEVLARATNPPFQSADLMLDLIEEIGRSGEALHYPLSQFVVRREQMAPLAASILPDVFGVNKIWTRESLAAREIPGPPFETPVGFYLKRTPTIDQLDASRKKIVTEWWHTDTYSTFIYPDDPI